jgi:type II secretory pathway pseudopilin PulG
MVISRSSLQSGFAYLGALFVVALVGLGLAATGMTSAMERRRVQEKQLLHVGREFRNAIASYHEHTPGTVKQYPRELEDLLLDMRHFQTVRHLRRIYVDPLTHTRNWGLVRAPDGGVMGVFSRSGGVPLRVVGLERFGAKLVGDERFSNIHFVYSPAED